MDEQSASTSATGNSNLNGTFRGRGVPRRNRPRARQAGPAPLDSSSNGDRPENNYKPEEPATVPLKPPNAKRRPSRRQPNEGQGSNNNPRQNKILREQVDNGSLSESVVPPTTESVSKGSKAESSNSSSRGRGRARRGSQPNNVRGRGQSRSQKPQQSQAFTAFNPNAVEFVPRALQQDPSSSNDTCVFNQNEPKNLRGIGSGRIQNAQRRGRGKGLLAASKSSVNYGNMSQRERLIHQLLDEDYECGICCQVVKSREGIWSCKKCYQMFHISGGCIVTWAKKNRADDNDNRWRCPFCQTLYDAVPYNYYCFCGKDRNPSYTFGETPHSCGNVCGGSRGPGCPHPCSELCHPGPCVECPVMVTKRCSCGATEKAVRCGSELVVKCDNVCNKILNCGRHYCKQLCHGGPCANCDHTVVEVCFCGDSTRTVLCENQLVGSKYSCHKPCAGFYDCGKHKCEIRCHDRITGCGPCPSDPMRVVKCPCGKMRLSELGASRTSCEDPIPSCGGVCDKVLQCGAAGKRHRCREKCHSGPCPPCNFNTSIVCRCGQQKSNLPCLEYVKIIESGEYHCEKRCKKKKSCGVHKCQETCCILDEHICMQICNKRLSCGNHFCENICHAGPCGRCLNAGFEEQFCHCGKNVRLPPIPCGSPLPECNEPCARPHACGHPPGHTCHSEPNCPPCTVLVERECYGKHEIRKNIPCHITSVSCGRPCGKPLPCGAHNCQRRCHSGECMQDGEKCVLLCNHLRSCEHPCALPCHSTSPCPESVCKQMVTVMCDCGRRKEQMKCVELQKELNRLHACRVAELVENCSLSDISSKPTLKRSPSFEQLNCLTCNDECRLHARNKRLADALSVVTDDNGEIGEPTITFTESMKLTWKNEQEFAMGVEKLFFEILSVLSDATFSGNSYSKHLPPMSMDQRRFVHEYASYFQLQTESVDPAPKRSVIVTGRRGSSQPPMILLSHLSKFPGVLSSAGHVTLRSNINEEIKRNAQASIAAEAREGLRKLKSTSRAVKRVPQIASAAPVEQKNAFALLGSDDEDEKENPLHMSNELEHTATAPPSESQEVSPDWWDDDENKTDSADQVPEDPIPSTDHAKVDSSKK